MRKLEDIGKWNRKIIIVGEAPAAPALNEPTEIAESFDLFHRAIHAVFESLTEASEDGKEKKKKWKLNYASLSYFKVGEALRNTRASLCTIATTSEPEMARLAENIISLADLSLQFGAFVDWDHHKASRKEAVTAPRRKGGRKSGEVRGAGRTWTVHATELMKSARDNDEALSKNKVAEEAFDKWSNNEGGERPSFETMKSFVTELEKKGKLPPKVKLVPKPRCKTPAQFG
jgi:hypothetical protein